MNKKIMKAVLAIAIVFLFAAMPISGMIGSPISRMVRADDAVGVVRNVAPTVNVAMGGSKAIVYNSGSDSITFTAQVIDRNREDDICNATDAYPCWWNISRVGGNYTNKTVIIASTPSISEAETGGQVNLYNATPNDGILAISSINTGAGYVWTCPATWAVGYYWSNLTIRDKANNRLDFAAFQFEVRVSIKTIGIYNYTGLAVDIVTPFFWNFTTTDPSVFNVTSGNWSYAGTTEPATNYGYSNATGRLWSYWIIVNNSGGATNLFFNISFGATGFISGTNGGTPITTGNFIRFEYNRTSVLTWENNATAPDAARPSAVEGAYVKDGDGNDQAANDGMYMFQFNAASQNIWIRFMVDIPFPCRASTDYTCAYSVTA